MIKHERVTYVDHCVYSQVVWRKFISQAVNVDMQAFGVERLTVSPCVGPESSAGPSDLKRFLWNDPRPNGRGYLLSVLRT